MNLTQRTKVSRALAGAVAGTSTSTGDIIDMQGYEGAVFNACTGLIVTGGTCVYQVWQSTSTGSTGTALSGATVTATTAGSTVHQINTIEIAKPLQRYVHLAAITATANVTLGGASVTQYGAKKMPPGTGSNATAPAVVASPTT